MSKRISQPTKFLSKILIIYFLVKFSNVLTWAFFSTLSLINVQHSSADNYFSKCLPFESFLDLYILHLDSFLRLSWKRALRKSVFFCYWPFVFEHVFGLRQVKVSRKLKHLFPRSLPHPPRWRNRELKPRCYRKLRILSNFLDYSSSSCHWSTISRRWQDCKLVMNVCKWSSRHLCFQYYYLYYAYTQRNTYCIRICVTCFKYVISLHTHTMQRFKIHPKDFPETFRISSECILDICMLYSKTYNERIISTKFID